LSEIPQDQFASQDDAEYVRGQHGGVGGGGGFSIVETTNCKYGCQVWGSPGWMEAVHYPECLSRMNWQAIQLQQEKERQRMHQEKLGHTPIYTDGGSYVVNPSIPSTVISEAELRKKAAYHIGTDEYRKRIDEEWTAEALAEMKARGGGVLVCKDGTILNKDGMKIGVEVNNNRNEKG